MLGFERLSSLRNTSGKLATFANSESCNGRGKLMCRSTPQVRPGSKEWLMQKRHERGLEPQSSGKVRLQSRARRILGSIRVLCMPDWVLDSRILRTLILLRIAAQRHHLLDYHFETWKPSTKCCNKFLSIVSGCRNVFWLSREEEICVDNITRH